MELDDLKNRLNIELGKPTVKPLTLALKGKTTHILSKLKRTVLIELVLTSFCIIAFIAIALFAEWKAHRIYFGTFGIILAFFIPINYYLLKRITALQAANIPVKENLQKLITLIRAYIKKYFQFTMALVPLCTIYAGFLSYTYRVQSVGVAPLLQHNDVHLFTKLMLIAFALMGFLALCYFLTKWYLKKMYGNYITQLENSLAELETE
jgi:hypothetical protein